MRAAIGAAATCLIAAAAALATYTAGLIDAAASTLELIARSL